MQWSTTLSILGFIVSLASITFMCVYIYRKTAGPERAGAGGKYKEEEFLEGGRSGLKKYLNVGRKGPSSRGIDGVDNKWIFIACLMNAVAQCWITMLSMYLVCAGYITVVEAPGCETYPGAGLFLICICCGVSFWMLSMATSGKVLQRRERRRRILMQKAAAAAHGSRKGPTLALTFCLQHRGS